VTERIHFISYCGALITAMKYGVRWHDMIAAINILLNDFLLDIWLHFPP
jgi:hypothetical protein